MDPFLSLVAGVFVGILANIGFGPITILAITRRLRYGIRAGMEVGIICSILDGIYSFIAAGAAGIMTSFLSKYSTAMKILGSFILFTVALGLLRQVRGLNQSTLAESRGKRHPSAVVSTVLLFVTNPTIPVFWLSVAGLAMTYGLINDRTTSAVLFAMGCSLGGALRYVVLMRYIFRAPERIKIGLLKKILIILAIILVALAAYGLLEVILK